MKNILRLGAKKYSIDSPVKSPVTRSTWCGGSTDEECDWLIRTTTPSRRPVSRDGRPLPPGPDVIGCRLAMRAAHSISSNTQPTWQRVTWTALSQRARPWPENARITTDWRLEAMPDGGFPVAAGWGRGGCKEPLRRAPWGPTGQTATHL